jgi:hypothetical protein
MTDIERMDKIAELFGGMEALLTVKNEADCTLKQRAISMSGMMLGGQYRFSICFDGKDRMPMRSEKQEWVQILWADLIK